MSKFATHGLRPNVTSPISTTGEKIQTHQGGQGYARDAKSDLFLLAVANFVQEKTFYESADDRDERFEQLLHAVTAEDADWMGRFIPWLRDEANMRSASIVAAGEYVAAGGTRGRQLVSAALQRADEPAEMLSYWIARHGRRIPKAVKRGVADAIVRLYTEKAALKYDGKGRSMRFADVIELVHPSPATPSQNQLFKYLLDERHGRDLDPEVVPEMIWDAKRVSERLAAGETVSAEDIKRAGINWERASSHTKMDAAAWERQIPSMGYMALLRNLRNFDESGVGVQAYNQVVAKLTDPQEVARSRQFPFRFWSAYKQLTSERWKYPLEQALELSLANVPALDGRTLVMLDVSGSMIDPMSGRSEMQRWEVAALFAIALAKRAKNADLVAYNTGYAEIGNVPGASIFSFMREVRANVGGGTDTWGATKAVYKGHDRVVILTDEQTGGSSYRGYWGYSSYETDPGVKAIPLVHTFNLAGYAPAHTQSGERGRYTYGGLNDSAFKAITLIEAGNDGAWPF